MNDEPGLAPIEYAMFLGFTAAITLTAWTDLGPSVLANLARTCAEFGKTCLRLTEL